MTQRAATLMVQGTASSVGKSLLTTGLCRIYARQGYRVAPFKAQNMALNSYVTIDGGEIGRAQAIQADAAGVAATVDMNPILLKPDAERSAQVVVQGKALRGMSAREYHELKPKLREIIVNSLEQLRRDYDLVIMEGAGSPVEINLKAHDIVNMFVATQMKSPVLLVGDIDRGGIFASMLGTLDLLEAHERELVCGLVVNKFRGDPELFHAGIDFLEKRSGKSVIGLVPFLKGLRIAEEDSLALDERPKRLSRQQDVLDIAIIRYPRISNYDEFDALEHEADVHVAYVNHAKEILDADLVILPGSKSTVSDLAWLRSQGFDQALSQRHRNRQAILAICGGCQMMGSKIFDPLSAESDQECVEGLGLAPYDTVFRSNKTTERVLSQVCQEGLFHRSNSSQYSKAGMEAYEIHMGELEFHSKGTIAHFAEVSRIRNQSKHFDGYHDYEHRLVTTLLHGLFENEGFRSNMLTELWSLRGQQRSMSSPAVITQKQALDRLADHLEEHLNMDQLNKHIWPNRS